MDSLQYLDPDVLARLEKMGRGFSRRLIALFLEHSPRRLDTALAGGRAGDWKAVEDAAHSLKSSAGNLGAVRLRELADRVEAAAAAGRSGGPGAGYSASASVTPLLAELELAFARTKELLLAYREKGPS